MPGGTDSEETFTRRAGLWGEEKLPHALPAIEGRQGTAPPQVAADRMVSAAFLCGGEQEVFRASAAKTSAT